MTQLKTQKVTRGHLQHVSKQTGVSVSKLRKMIRNFNSARLSDFFDHDDKEVVVPAMNKHERQRRARLRIEDASTNSMGASSATSGPIQTFDPLMNIKKKKLLKRFKNFLKT